MRFVARRANVSHAMRHGHVRADRIVQSLRDLTAYHDIAIRSKRFAGRKGDRRILTKAISLKKLRRRANDAKAAMTVAERVGHGPLHRGMRLPPFKGRDLDRAGWGTNAEYTAEQHLQRSATCANDEIRATNGAGKTFAHPGTHVFDADQQRHAQRDGHYRQRCRQQTTTQRAKGETRNQHGRINVPSALRRAARIGCAIERCQRHRA